VPSGENQVFEAEGKMLRQRGHEVGTFVRHSDSIRERGVLGSIQGAMSTPWSIFAARAIQQRLKAFRPEVVHVHNTFPLLSPSIFHAIGHRAARVLTLHNYRLFCPAAIPMRAAKICTDCLDQKSVLPAIRHGCYRGSRLATLPMAANVALHRLLNTWEKQVDAFIALTEFQRDVMVQAGLPGDLVHVKPNFYPGTPAMVPWCDRRESVVFAGRLGAEKGVIALVKAWVKWGALAPELRIAGDGELRNELERLAASAPDVPIVFLGQVSAEQAQEEVSRARLVLLPSEWFEGFPMVVREAFAFGTPAAVSNIGPLPSIVQDGISGVIFEPGNPESLLNVVRNAWQNEGVLQRLGRGARYSFETLYNEDANYRILMDIYDQAIDVSNGRKEKAS